MPHASNSHAIPPSPTKSAEPTLLQALYGSPVFRGTSAASDGIASLNSSAGKGPEVLEKTVEEQSTTLYQDKKDICALETKSEEQSIDMRTLRFSLGR